MSFKGMVLVAGTGKPESMSMSVLIIRPELPFTLALLPDAAQGIGRSIALRLAGNDFDLAVDDRAATGANGCNCSAHVVDAYVEANASQMVVKVVKIHGGWML